MKKILVILIAVIGFGFSANAISARVTGTEKMDSGLTYINYEINPEGQSGWYSIRITWIDESGEVRDDEKEWAGSVSASHNFDTKLRYGVKNYHCCATVEVWWYE